MPVIGFLGSTSPGGQVAPFVAAFLQGLSEIGYVEEQNVTIEWRWAEGHYDRLPALAAELVRLNVDVIATSGGDPSALAAKNATSTIPIVSVVGNDPVVNGLVASFARPGGNLTGFSILNVELTPKRLELLSELVPQARVIAFLVNPNSPQTEPVMRDMQEAARVKGVSLPVLKASSESEINAAFALLAENYEPVRSWSRRSVFRRPPRSARCVSREPCNSGRFMRPVSTPRPAA
jgi:putative ABC transport system substrate-binding protein